MSSSPQSTPPPWWNESAAFRETTLRLFEKPEDAVALRHVGAMLHDMALEVVGYGHDPESSIRAELRAVAADLRYAQGFLAMVHQAAEESDLFPRDEALARFAGGKVADVAALAEAIERELRS